MRYKRQKPTRQTDIEMTPLKETIEAIFSPDNIDDDCDIIGNKVLGNGNDYGYIML